MESNTPKFRLRLNLFDGIVLILALAVGASLLWSALKPAAVQPGDTASTATVRYTVRFQRWIEDTSDLIQPGDRLVDNIKNFELGQVVSAQVVPAQSIQLNHLDRVYQLADIPGYEDVLVTVEAPCAVTNEAITVGGGYALRVGATAYIRGVGYMASGPIVAIEREGL